MFRLLGFLRFCSTGVCKGDTSSCTICKNIWKRRVLPVSCASLLAALFERTGSGKHQQFIGCKTCKFTYIQKTKLHRLEVVVSKTFIFTPEPRENDHF